MFTFDPMVIRERDDGHEWCPICTETKLQRIERPDGVFDSCTGDQCPFWAQLNPEYLRMERDGVGYTVRHPFADLAHERPFDGMFIG